MHELSVRLILLLGHSRAHGNKLPQMCRYVYVCVGARKSMKASIGLHVNLHTSTDL